MKHKFNSCWEHQRIAFVAHQVEQRIENPCVAGSSPAKGTSNKEIAMAIFVVLVIFIVLYFFIRKLWYET